MYICSSIGSVTKIAFVPTFGSKSDVNTVSFGCVVLISRDILPFANRFSEDFEQPSRESKRRLIIYPTERDTFYRNVLLLLNLR